MKNNPVGCRELASGYIIDYSKINTTAASNNDSSLRRGPHEPFLPSSDNEKINVLFIYCMHVYICWHVYHSTLWSSEGNLE